MLYTTTPTGMRALAGDYREADRRSADAHRTGKAAKTETAAKAAPAATAEQSIAPHRIGWLTALLSHAR